MNRKQLHSYISKIILKEFGRPGPSLRTGNVEPPNPDIEDVYDEKEDDDPGESPDTGEPTNVKPPSGPWDREEFERFRLRDEKEPTLGDNTWPVPSSLSSLEEKKIWIENIIEAEIASHFDPVSSGEEQDARFSRDIEKQEFVKQNFGASLDRDEFDQTVEEYGMMFSIKDSDELLEDLERIAYSLHLGGSSSEWDIIQTNIKGVIPENKKNPVEKTENFLQEGNPLAWNRYAQGRLRGLMPGRREPTPDKYAPSYEKSPIMNPEYHAKRAQQRAQQDAQDIEIRNLDRLDADEKNEFKQLLKQIFEYGIDAMAKDDLYRTRDLANKAGAKGFLSDMAKAQHAHRQETIRLEGEEVSDTKNLMREGDLPMNLKKLIKEELEKAIHEKYAGSKYADDELQKAMNRLRDLYDKTGRAKDSDWKEENHPRRGPEEPEELQYVPLTDNELALALIGKVPSPAPEYTPGSVQGLRSTLTSTEVEELRSIRKEYGIDTWTSNSRDLHDEFKVYGKYGKDNVGVGWRRRLGGIIDEEIEKHLKGFKIK